MPNPLSGNFNFSKHNANNVGNFSQNFSNNIFSAENKQAFNSMVNFLNGFNNQEQLVSTLMNSNPKIREIYDLYRSGSAEQIVRNKCNELGIRVEDLISFITKE